MNSIPMDLLVEIFARVSSESISDLFNAKFCCKEFLEATNHGYIFRHVTLHHKKFPVIPWTVDDDNVKLFLERCKENGNAEVLYREGMIDYFSKMKPEIGLENLRKAAEKGHAEASYVYAIILLLTRGKTDRNGRDFLRKIIVHDTTAVPSWSRQRKVRSLKECRKRAYEILDVIRWKHEVAQVLKDERQQAMGGGRLPCLSNNNSTATTCRPINRWIYGMEQDFEEWCCENCLLHYETTAFCSILDPQLYYI